MSNISKLVTDMMMGSVEIEQEITYGTINFDPG